MKQLADILKQIRLKAGLSQAEFAKKIGVSQRTWSAYEMGETRPKMATILALESMGYRIDGLTDGAASYAIKEIPDNTGLPKEEVKRQAVAHLQELAKNYQLGNSMEDVPSPKFKTLTSQKDFFKFQYGKILPLATEESDTNAMVLLPLYNQTAAAGRGQQPTQLDALADYIPIVYEMLGGSNPKDCGVVRIVGDSMTDMGLLDGDLAVFDRTRIEGDGVYVISIGSDVRVKHLEYRPIERKIVISSENAKRYPNPEIISYEQAENLLRVHGKVICWMHRHPY